MDLLNAGEYRNIEVRGWTDEQKWREGEPGFDASANPAHGAIVVGQGSSFKMDSVVVDSTRGRTHPFFFLNIGNLSVNIIFSCLWWIPCSSFPWGRTLWAFSGHGHNRAGWHFSYQSQTVMTVPSNPPQAPFDKWVH